MILGIDPGPCRCGVVLYDEQARRVVETHARMEVGELLRRLRGGVPAELVAIERVQSYGIAGGSLLRTAETVGRLWEAVDHRGQRVRLLYRREILRALDVTGTGSRDALVRARLIEIHGGSREIAVGRKATPGPLYGVATHAWAALAVAVVGAQA